MGSESVTSHRTGNREVTGSNPVEVLNFFQASLRNCINCVHCDDHFFIFIIGSCCVRLHTSANTIQQLPTFFRPTMLVVVASVDLLYQQFERDLGLKLLI